MDSITTVRINTSYERLGNWLLAQLETARVNAPDSYLYVSKTNRSEKSHGCFIVCNLQLAERTQDAYGMEEVIAVYPRSVVCDLTELAVNFTQLDLESSDENAAPIVALLLTKLEETYRRVGVEVVTRARPKSTKFHFNGTARQFAAWLNERERNKWEMSTIRRRGFPVMGLPDIVRSTTGAPIFVEYHGYRDVTYFDHEIQQERKASERFLTMQFSIDPLPDGTVTITAECLHPDWTAQYLEILTQLGQSQPPITTPTTALTPFLPGTVDAGRPERDGERRGAIEAATPEDLTELSTDEFKKRQVALRESDGSPKTEWYGFVFGFYEAHKRKGARTISLESLAEWVGESHSTIKRRKKDYEDQRGSKVEPE